MRWDLYVMILAIWNCVSIPYDVSFEVENTIYGYFDNVTDLCFAADIVFNFRTTFINIKTGFEVVESGKIVRNYIQSGRFFVDLLASIPFDSLFSIIAPGQGGMTFKLFGLLKLVRLLRLGRIIRYMKFKQGFKIGIRIVQLLFFLLMLVHWIGCIWYILVKDEADGWIPPKDLDKDGIRTGKTDFYKSSKVSRYFVVFYYAILTMVGNELAPQNNLQTVFSSLIIITGAVVSAFIFGNMAALMATMNKKSNHFDEQLDLVNATMRSMKLPEEMQDQVISFMRHV
jgi:hypothetical protein